MPRFALALFTLTSLAVAAPVPKAKKPDPYPHALGTKWEYIEFGQECTVSVEEVVEVTEKDGVITFKVDYATNGGPKSSESYRLKGGELSLLSVGGSEYDPPLVLRPGAWKAGDSWECKYTHAGGEHEETIGVGEEEELTTPAGTFKVYPITRTFTKPARQRALVLWYSNEVGMVRKQSAGANVPAQELKAFTPGKK